MSYIIKSTSGIINAKLTDAGRFKLSKGDLNFTYFQIGDSELCYNCYTTTPAYGGLNIIRPKDNAANLTPQFPGGGSSATNIKYPIPIDPKTPLNTYGELNELSSVENIYNTARVRGFFTGSTTAGFTALTTTAYTRTNTWDIRTSGLTGNTVITIQSGSCSSTIYIPRAGDFAVIKYKNPYNWNTKCADIELYNPYGYLTYKVIAAGTSGGTMSITLDRPTANFSAYTVSLSGVSHMFVYPGGNMLSYYGYDTPIPYWNPNTLAFDSSCNLSDLDVNVWNMNICWTETIAGTNTATHVGKEFYGGSTGYCGTKEYLGYETSDATTDTDVRGTFIYNSFGELVKVTPEEQKGIGIVHFTNETINNFYGEKLAMQPSTDPELANGIGSAANFKMHIPTLLWHKKKSTGTGVGNETKTGQSFYTDPPTTNGLFLQQYYIKSKVNPDMNPGIRYFHLWDDNYTIQSDGSSIPNRVGKVFPDLHLVTLDDEELISALSYKSNRNWTLPKPKYELIDANTCNCGSNASSIGLFNSSTGYDGTPLMDLHFTYMLVPNSGYTPYLHCNYYSVVSDGSGRRKDLKITFGSEFPYLRQHTYAMSGSGFQANTLLLLSQFTEVGVRPSPELWKSIDITSQISSHTVGNPILATGMTSSIFYLTANNYTGATTYNLNNYISLKTAGSTTGLTFGEEYFFYGNIETDIQATIYELKYGIQLGANQFGGVKSKGSSLNPTYEDFKDDNGFYTSVNINEIGLFDRDKNLVAIAKASSPIPRGNQFQNFLVKIDF